MKVRIDALTRKEARQALNHPQIIFTPNPEILLEAARNKKFKRALKRGTLMLPDGNGLLVVSTLLKFTSRWLRLFLFFPACVLFLFWKAPFRKQLPEIIHGSDFMLDVVTWAEQHEKSVFFLGGKNRVAAQTADVFQAKHPRLKVAGFSSADPGKEACELVKKSGADILFVAYGAPKQELWIAQYASTLKLHIVMGVGGSFDFWSGGVRRAPRVLRKLGMEWLWRLMLHPFSRVRRIWKAVIVFPFTCLFSSSVSLASPRPSE